MFSDLQFRMRALFRRGTMEADLDDELRAHLEHQAEKYIRCGLSREDAERRARLDFGDLDQIKEECRESWGVLLVDKLKSDAQFGLNQVRRNPTFATVAAMALVLGIAANTALFSDMSTVVQRISPQNSSHAAVLSARNDPPAPVTKHHADAGVVAHKAHKHAVNEPRKPVTHHKSRTDVVRVRHAAAESVTVVAFEAFRTQGSAQMVATAWTSGSGQNGRSRFVLVRETWKGFQPGANGQALQRTLYVTSVSCTTMEVGTGNSQYPPEAKSKLATYNASGVLQNSKQRSGPAAIGQLSACASVYKSLSNL
jgi:hypothetical protein